MSTDDTADRDFVEDETIVVLVYEPDGQTATAALREEAVAIATPNGEIYTFGVDPETGGLMVVVEGVLTVGLIKRLDGEYRKDSLILLARGERVDMKKLVN